MYFNGMSIKPVDGQSNHWHIVAIISHNGRLYKAERKHFMGAHSRAVSEWGRLKVELRARAEKETKERASKFFYFSGLLDAFEAVREYPKGMSYYGRKLRADIGHLHIDQLESGLLKYFALLNTEHVLGKKMDDHGKYLVTGKLYSNGTKNRVLAICRMVCRHAYRASLIAIDPLKLVRPWSEKPRNRILSADELGRIRAKIDEMEPWLSPAFEFSVRIPIRLSDLCSLTRDNLDLFTGVIRLAAQKTGAQQIIPIPPDMLRYFQRLPKAQVYLFERNGGQLKSFHKAWGAVLTTAGVTGLHWHDLRHHACTWLSNTMGLKTHQLMVIGGWKRREMIEVYHNTQPENVAQEIAGVFKTHQVEQSKKILKLKAG